MEASSQREDRLRQGIAVFAVVQLAIGAMAAFVPGAFFDAVADFGVRNDHLLGDIATYYLASGAALALAVGRASWRAPVLFVVAVQYGLHTINHLIDIGESNPSWVGPLDFVSLAIATGLLVYLYRLAASRTQ